MICLGVTKMKTISIGLTVPCDMPMPNIIQAIGTSGRRADSPRTHTYILYNEQVFPKWRYLLLIDHLSEGIQIILIVSDKSYT